MEEVQVLVTPQEYTENGDARGFLCGFLCINIGGIFC